MGQFHRGGETVRRTDRIFGMQDRKLALDVRSLRCDVAVPPESQLPSEVEAHDQVGSLGAAAAVGELCISPVQGVEAA
jgi:hypothetical protein